RWIEPLARGARRLQERQRQLAQRIVELDEEQRRADGSREGLSALRLGELDELARAEVLSAPRFHGDRFLAGPPFLVGEVGAIFGERKFASVGRLTLRRAPRISTPDQSTITSRDFNGLTFCAQSAP